jgi:predicted nucleotide-binding protein (sugar kinase/HSP70/actin superfamily)
MVRYIAGFGCQKGTVESREELKALNRDRKLLQKRVLNLVKEESKALFEFDYNIENPPKEIIENRVISTLKGWGPTFRRDINRKFLYSNREDIEYRKKITIAIPKVLNIYTIAPFIRAYLISLGIQPQNIIFSNFTNEDMYLEGSKYGSVDACYPAKVAQAHVYSLMFDKKFIKKDIKYIWFPSIIDMKNFVQYTMGNSSCPIVSGTPRVVYSAFTKEINLFKKSSIEYIDESFHFDNKELLKRELFNIWKDRLKITKDESNWATIQGLKAQKAYLDTIMQRGREILDSAEKNKEIVLLLLGRPYHMDKGINHEILEEFQALGFKSISINSIPKDKEYLYRFFKEDIENGYIKDPFDIRDVWRENFSVNSAQKVWGAKFASRHPNVAVIDLSSFKCGHDAPTFAIIDRILGSSHTPHLALHDIDANKPTGSIKIRVKTFAYSLREYQKNL